MPIPAGRRLGPYEIVALLGAGGMGEVYRARDTRLDRAVAIKVIPAAMAASPELRERFDREARAISALNHPNICSLYDVGHHEGIDFLVMEYLEGQTLSDRLLTGKLSIADTLRHAIEIADALDKAHRAGIVHRDVKPANVFLTKAGVKLLDFGLARTGVTAIPSRLSMSPTTPPNQTAQGTILGTFQYMAPEQLEGLDADARADIFAFGAVVYEMLTGTPAFHGKNQASLTAAIMSAQPVPIADCILEAPRALDRLVMTCLAKDRERRWQSAGDAAFHLRWIAEPADADARGGRNASTGRRPLLWGSVAVVSILAAIGASLQLRAPAVAAAAPTRFSVSPPENSVFARRSSGGMLAVSPDGRTLAYVAAPAGGRSLLWLRPLDALAARPIPGTEEGDAPFWSTDSRSIGFFAGGKLKAVAIDGGEPRTICDATGIHAATWGRGGVILFVSDIRGTHGLSRVSAAGGPVTSETKPDLATGETGHLLPYFLADGQHYLYNVTAAGGVTVNIGALGSRTPRRLLTSSELTTPSSLAVASPGELLFVRAGTLFALPFDASRLERSGEPRPVAENVQSLGAAGGAAAFSASANGVLAYWRGAEPPKARLAWLTRDGRETATAVPPGSYGRVALAPDGNHVAIEGLDAQNAQAIFIADLARGTTTRFTNDAFSIWPIWSPDGTSVIFSSTRNDGMMAPYRQSFTAGGDALRLFGLGKRAVATDWSADGRTIIVAIDPPDGSLGRFALTGESAPRPVSPSPSGQSEGHLSPDGRWIAYVANDKGGQGVYVTAFPDGGAQWRISPGSGDEPRWRGDGRELFYRTNGRVMAVPIRASTAFEAGMPARLFDVPTAHYSVTRDGQRFLLVVREPEASSPPITVLTNWPATMTGGVK